MDKQKRQQPQLSSQTILILWAVIQAFGWGIIYLLMLNLRYDAPNLILYGFVGLLSGGITGALQHTLIERGTGVQLKHWLTLTALGTTIGFVLITALPTQVYEPYMIILPLFIVPAFCQWLSIRKHTRAGLLWIVANGVTPLVFVMFAELIVEQNPIHDSLILMVPALLQGVIAGFVIVWLLRQVPKQALTLEKAKVG